MCEDGADTDLFKCQGAFSGLDGGDVEDIVHQLKHVLAAFLNGAGIVGQTLYRHVSGLGHAE